MADKKVHLRDVATDDWVPVVYRETADGDKVLVRFNWYEDLGV